MAVRTFIVNLNGGDLVTADTDLIFKIYGSADSYTTAIVTTGSHTSDANVTVSGASATIVYEVGSETLFKVSALDEAGNESVLSTATGITDTTIPATPIITSVVDISTKSIILTTSSTSAIWTPTSLVNTGSDLTWSVSGAVTESEIAYSGNTKPTYDFTTLGTKIITITSVSDFVGLTDFRLDDKEIATADITNATDLQIVSIKINPSLTTLDVSTLVNATNLTIRDNGLTTLDVSNCTSLLSLYAYGNNLPDIELDNILIDIDNNGLSNGTIAITGNSGSLTAASVTAYNSLISKGWTIDVPVYSAPDTTNPVVGTLSNGTPTSTIIPISCTATDNVGVTNWDIYVDAVFNRNVVGNVLSSYSLNGLTASTNYDIFVVAKDAAGNTDTSNIINVTTASAGTPSFRPVLYGFNVDNTNKNRVNFSTLEPLTSGSTYGGFTINSKTITGVTINSGSTSGHYFTVSSDFNFWNNNQIRYSGTGSNITDGTNTPYAFTSENIVNNINEPSTSVDVYVWSGATGANNGTSEANAFTTLQAALTSISGQTGRRICVKAGNYSGNYTSIPSGSTTAPNVIEGYKTTVGDITTNYYSYTVDSGDGAGGTVTTLDSSEMPLFTGSSRESGGGTCFNLNGDDNIIIRNIQITNYNEGFYTQGSDRNILERVNVVNVGSTTDDAAEGRGIVLYHYQLNSTEHRVKDCYVVNASSNAYLILATYSLFENCRAYCNEYDSADDVLVTTDYYYANQGNNNIFKDSIAWKDTPNGNGHNGHGFAMKGLSGTYPNNYNLVDNCLAVNILGAFQLRHPSSENNVIKNCEAHANVANRTGGDNNTSGIEMLSGNANNIVENCYFHHVDNGVNMVNNGESATTVIGEFVTIRNCIFTNMEQLFRFGALSTVSGGQVENISFFNNTVDTADQLVYGDYTTLVETTNFNLTNNIFTNITSFVKDGTALDDGETPTDGFSYDYNNFYSSNASHWSYNTTGTNALNINPSFTGLYIPTNTSLKAGTPLVNYDYDGTERDSTTPTIGAKEI